GELERHGAPSAYGDHLRGTGHVTAAATHGAIEAREVGHRIELGLVRELDGHAVEAEAAHVAPHPRVEAGAAGRGELAREEVVVVDPARHEEAGEPPEAAVDRLLLADALDGGDGALVRL